MLVMCLVGLLSLASCASGEPDRCSVVEYKPSTPPASTVKSYKIVVHKDVPAERVGLILDAAFEWVTASSGAVVFEVTYADFDFTGADRPAPPAGTMWIYTEPKADKSSSTVGVCWSWSKDKNGRPSKSEIWIQDDLSPRVYYLTALHEIGHGLGLDHQENKDIPSIMYPWITDVGDHPTCDDKKKLCQIWGCAPGC